MNSIRTRLLLTFTLIGITPYLFILLYISYWQSNQTVQTMQYDYNIKALHAKKMVETTLLSLDEEVEFLSNLEVMDDIISNDVDFQISRILQQKSLKAHKKYMQLFALNNNKKIIASSELSSSNINIQFPELSAHQMHFIVEKNIFIVKIIQSSFDARQLGYLVAILPLERLTIFLLKDDIAEFKIVQRKENIDLQEDENFYYRYLNLNNILSGYTLSYTIDKKELFKDIDNFLFYIFVLILLGVILIWFISKKVTLNIIKPIFSLKETSEKIISSKHFHMRIEPSKIEEFNDLTKSFNTLFQTADTLFERLHTENKRRLKNYINLSETFNTISQSNSKESVIQLFLESLRKNLTHTIEIREKFVEDKTIKKLIAQDFIENECKVIGYLYIAEAKSLNDQEIIFINSVSLMLKNQLEKLSLLEKISTASNAKSAFISAMSHELRTPLNSIIGYAQYLITYEEMQEEQKETIAKMETSGYHLLEIINDILDIAKIESGKIEKNIQPIDVMEQLQESIDITQALIEDKGLALYLDIESIREVTIESDKKIFKQIIINIISNAMKFTNEGTISLRAKKETNTLIIEIEDTGIGIKTEDLSKIFDEFTQLKNAKKTASKGSGLGLALCKHLAKEIGATITIMSEGESKGTKAVLEFNL